MKKKTRIEICEECILDLALAIEIKRVGGIYQGTAEKIFSNLVRTEISKKSPLDINKLYKKKGSINKKI